MKKNIYSCLLLTLLAAFVVSCSQSEDMELTDHLSETRADSPLLETSPTEVYFSDVRVFSVARNTVNIKTAGLSSLAMLTRFDIVIQGADADQFSFSRPELGLTELLQALMGGGVDIPVFYSPTIVGPHEAELLITASLLGVLMPVQITVPLHGTTPEISIPRILYTVPVNRGTVEWDARVPNTEYADRGQYHVDFVFDQEILIERDDLIGFANLTTATIRSIDVVNGNTLRLTIWEDVLAIQNTILLEPNAIVNIDAAYTNVGNEEITLVYTVTGELPDNEI